MGTREDKVTEQCKSIYYGSLKDWKCKLPAGHTGAHAADKIHLGKIMIAPRTWTKEENYCTWTDEDADYTYYHALTKKLGGK